MVIRCATMRDIGGILEMGEEMHAASSFAPMRYDHRHFGEFLVQFIASPASVVFLAVHGEKVAGAVLCLCTPAYFGPDRVAQELALYVRPEFRSTRAAVKLLSAYVQWAKQQGAVRVNAGNSAGAPDEQYVRLLQHAGFTRAGSLMYLSM